VDERFVEQVLALVERIPAGRVMSYGAIAEALQAGYGPRYVGRVMSTTGAAVPWWRVVRADGTPADCHDGEAARLLLADETPMRPDLRRVDMPRAAWSPES